MTNEEQHFTLWKWSIRAPLLAPFGNYLGDRRRNEDEDGLLIGRPNQREKLLGALLDDTHRGAILVTGHRGSGKTTLVNYCLREYELALYERFQNRNVAKRLIWDLLIFSLLLMMLTGFMGFCSLILTALAVGKLNFSAAIIGLPLLILLIQPILMSWTSTRDLASWACKRETSKLWSMVLFIIIGGIATLIAAFPPMFGLMPLVFLLYFFEAYISAGIQPSYLDKSGMGSFLFFRSIFQFAISTTLLAPAIFETDNSVLKTTKWFVIWIISCTASTIFIAMAEYWSIRKNHELLVDKARSYTNAEGAQGGRDLNAIFFSRLIFQQTIFFQVLRHWIPTLVVNINLGLDTLDHRRVIEAMLMQLRTEYKRTFASWRSPTHIFSTATFSAGILAISWMVSSHLFLANFHHEALNRFDTANAPQNDRLPPSSSSATGGNFSLDATGTPEMQVIVRNPVEETHSLCASSNFSGGPPPVGLTLSCWLSPKALAPILYRTNAETSIGHLEPLSSLIAWTKASGDQTPLGNLKVRSFHILMFITAWLFCHRIFVRTWPYSRRLRHIDSLLRGLSGKTRQEWIAAESPWSRLAGVILGRDHETYVENDPLDPRTVETAALIFLKEIQESSIEIPSTPRQHFSLPAPEVIFKFDELDKLGVGVLPADNNPNSGPAPLQGLDGERRRSQALQRLFADLKNLISSGTARFIFIGGRNLHDEWHADLGDRRPLLTHIFTFEVFLPTLLTDITPTDSTDRRLINDINIRHFLLHLYKLSDYAQKKANDSHGVQSSRYLDSNIYSQTLIPEPESTPLKIYAPDGFEMNDHHAHDFMDDFIDFLCYRSRGNPRRLRMLIESFISSSKSLETEYYTRATKGREQPRSFLKFCEIDRVRIQIIAEIYRRFSIAIGQRFSFRDDRLLGGALHVSDFLLKFHRRAFGWRNLQRVDELVHVYRSPDLPQVLDLVIRSWTGRYLHRIRNGMYDYRFSAEFSQELQYLSRRNEDEMAALNFTFDEAQELKSIYQARYSQAKDEHSWEFTAALGELHEYDEEYELARFYYFKALAALDSGLERGVKLNGRSSALLEIVSQSETGLEILRRWIAWAINRLRVGLQIGMTYERAGDLEQAQARYRVSRTFAAAVVRALLNSTKSRKNLEILNVLDIPDKGRPDFVSTLKNLNLLFQPAFAEAWVAQKLVGGVDTGVRILERSLWELRWLLPTVKDEYSPDEGRRLKLNEPKPQSREFHTNLYLTMGELHNKLGDLLFYKANLHISPNEGEEFRISRRGGFVGRAQYHYAIAVQELRSFITVRGNRSRMLQFGEGDITPDRTHPATEAPWPAFVYDAISDFLADIGDTLVARASPREILFSECSEDSPPILDRESFESRLRDTKKRFKKWLEGEEEAGDNWLLDFEVCFRNLESIHLSATLGKRNAQGARDPRPREEIHEGWPDLFSTDSWEDGFFDKRKTKKPEETTLWNSLNQPLSDEDSHNLIATTQNIKSHTAVIHHLIMILMSSSFLEEAGQMEDAARKAGRVVESTLTYIEMARCIAILRHHIPSMSHYFPEAWRKWHNHFFGSSTEDLRPSRFLLELATLGVAAAERAARLYQQSRHEFSDSTDRFSLGRQIPSQLGIQLCAIGLHLTSNLFSKSNHKSVSDHLIRRVASLLWETVGASHSTDRPAFCLGLREIWSAGQVDRSTARNAFIKLLDESIQRNSYQVLGRLFALKTRLDHLSLLNLEEPGLISRNGAIDFGELTALLSTLENTAETYDGPLHFTPFYLGVSQAMFSLSKLWGEPRRVKPCRQSEKEMRRARETLNTSIGTITMKKDFYRSFGKLFYLYDDFNDRRVHFNHGTQMAGGELTHYLIAILDAEIERITSHSDSLVIE